MRSRTPLPLFAALLLPSLAAAAGHPEVGAPPDPDACIACHAGETPGLVKDWQGGRHGLVLVKCFVCHGTTGADFTRRPATGRCRGCHADMVASVTPPKGRARDCFACHAPHALTVREATPNPHTKPQG